jgi:hypothetical protein
MWGYICYEGIMIFSAFGIFMSVLIFIALFATALFYCIYKLAPDSGLSKRLDSLTDKTSSLTNRLQSERFSEIYSPSLTIILFAELLLVIPIIISGFYLNAPYTGVVTAALFNGIIIPGLLFNRKASVGKEIQAYFLINSIDKIKIWFIKGKK